MTSVVVHCGCFRSMHMPIRLLFKLLSWLSILLKLTNCCKDYISTIYCFTFDTHEQIIYYSGGNSITYSLLTTHYSLLISPPHPHHRWHPLPAHYPKGSPTISRAPACPP